MKFLTLLMLLWCYEGLSVELKCKFEVDPHVGYLCINKNEELITSEDAREIISVQGQHLTGKNNDDVITFFSDFQKVNFFPRGLTKFFKNIEKIQLGFGSIKELTKEDLQQFGDKLKDFYFYGNELETVKADLFEFNPNLESISFRANKIKAVESGAFGGLNHLKALFFSFNTCINSDKVDREEVLELIKKVETDCKN